MVPTKKEIIQLHKKYSLSEKQFELCYTHCQVVEEIAMWCASNISEKVDLELLSAASLLHDVGSYMFMDERGNVHKEYYQLHALLGSKLLSEEGVSSEICRLIETHIKLGAPKQEVQEAGKKMPFQNYQPKNVEARILRYADRYHTKLPAFVSYESFMNTFQQKQPKQVKVIESYASEFGQPDIQKLAKKYGHSII